ncbi:MAG: class I SAM-dependent methyltransferase [Deltaproteobacteria bacterium]|nr:class I SAM-dependent methyltransferase [Deltaproteobacteria bacterium]
MSEKEAYSQAAGTGKYDKASGLLGKYDNVRRFWEDQVTGIFLRPALNKMVEQKKAHLERIRILDLGCGSGDGYDLLMGVTAKDPGIYEYITAVITPDMLKEYVGIEINDKLIKQAETDYGHYPKVRFIQDDLSSGLPESATKQDPFDIYLTSYGLGRYSYEWQDLWHYPQDQECFMDYRISYIYPEELRNQANVAIFPLRLITRDKIMHIIDESARESGAEIKPLAFFDRSILIGRHTDTGDYNKNCPKLRTQVNSLFEGYVRTDLESLLVDYVDTIYDLFAQ